jgi:peptidoglycan hydrolase-like protein with peptidoglycan-binding domain
MLSSKLLSPNARLQACEVEDSAHVPPGDQGEHVSLIQQALALIDGLTIAASETNTGFYGPSTAAAVLNYKTRRGIINFTYQSSPDNIVGKMTVKRLDDDLLEVEESGTEEFSGSGLRNLFGRIV